MVTYGDMVTLLLTFFVAIFTVAKIEGREFRLILSAFRGSLGLFEGGQTLSKGKLEEMGMNLESLPAQEKGKALSKAYREATENFKPAVKAGKVVITQDERGIIISLVGDSYFDPGSARLKEDTIRVLQKVGPLIKRLKSYVRIEGHADDTPTAFGPARDRYETNWELAAKRAINVVRYLQEEEGVDPKKLSAVSYGSHRPLVKGDTPEKRALNRRVDIVILPFKSVRRDYKEEALPEAKQPGIEWFF